MDAWKQITAAALIGTDRQPMSPVAAEGALREALSQAQAHASAPAPAQALLTAAALASPYMRAGAPALTPGSPAPAAPADTLRQPSPGVERLLMELLGGTADLPVREILSEFLLLAGRRGLAVPRRALPGVLEAGARDRSLREGIIATLDARGRWLAAQKPEWSYAVGGDDPSRIWDEGPTAARAAYLRELRATDPAAAREKLAESWKKESAQDRAAFIEILEIGLSDADESFLEAALDDRSKDVRRTTANLLSALPGSAFSRRAAERASRALTVESKLLRKKLIINLPEAITDADKRDGIATDHPRIHDLGEKARWLYATLAAAPLEHWRTLSGESPEALIELARKTEWNSAVIAGWAEAARRQRHSAWILALARDPKFKGKEFTAAVLLQALSPDELEAEALRVASGKAEEISSFYEAAHPIAAPWSGPLTEAAIAVNFANPTKKTWSQYGDNRLMLLAMRGDAEMFPRAETLARAALNEKPEFERAIEKFITLYSFRHSMSKELAS